MCCRENSWGSVIKMKTAIICAKVRAIIQVIAVIGVESVGATHKSLHNKFAKHNRQRQSTLTIKIILSITAINKQLLSIIISIFEL